jgi:site-specific DNA-methyltransferase (adenine-specific)
MQNEESNMDGTGGAVSAKMNIVTRRLDEIHPCPTNAKTHDQKQVDNVANCIRFAGWTQPIVIAQNGEIVIGHCRYLAARQLGCKEVPCLLKDELDERQLRALRVLDNKLNESPWDADLLKVELDDLDFSEMGIDVDFDIDIGGGAEPVEGEDDAPEVDANETPDSVRGAVYALGNHRLMCGDSTNKDDFEKLMAGDKADMVFTDPPYGVAIGDKNKALNEVQKAGRILENIEGDAMGEEELYATLRAAFENVRENCKDDAVYYVTSPQGGSLGLMMMMMKDAGLPVRHVLMWCKNCATFSVGRLDYDYKHEPIFYTWTKSHHNFRGGRCRTTVWDFDKPQRCDVHPTMKPVALVENAILDGTEAGMIVLDAFGGSGTTAIACEKQGRVCRMMELDPHYCDVIRRRWAEFTHGEGCDWKALTPKA